MRRGRAMPSQLGPMSAGSTEADYPHQFDGKIMFPTAEWWDRLLVPGLVPTSRISITDGRLDDGALGFVHGYRGL